MSENRLTTSSCNGGHVAKINFDEPVSKSFMFRACSSSVCDVSIQFKYDDNTIPGAYLAYLTYTYVMYQVLHNGDRIMEFEPSTPIFFQPLKLKEESLSKTNKL